MQLVHDVDKKLGALQGRSAPAVNAPRVIISHEGRSVTRSAARRCKPWVLRGVAEARPPIDPLMGWCGEADTHGQVELRFSTLEDAMAFARRRGWRFEVVGTAASPVWAHDPQAARAQEAEEALLGALAHYAWLEARYGDGSLFAVSQPAPETLRAA